MSPWSQPALVSVSIKPTTRTNTLTTFDKVGLPRIEICLKYANNIDFLKTTGIWAGGTCELCDRMVNWQEMEAWLQCYYWWLKTENSSRRSWNADPGRQMFHNKYQLHKTETKRKRFSFHWSSKMIKKNCSGHFFCKKKKTFWTLNPSCSGLQELHKTLGKGRSAPN